MLAAQGVRELQRAGIAARRKLRIPPTQRIAQRGRRLHARVRGGFDIERVRHRVTLHQRVIAREEAARQVPVRRPIQRKNPVVLVRLQAHRIPIGRALRLQRRRAERASVRTAPPAAIELEQHRSAPVTLVGRRRSAGKVHPKRHFIRQGELIDIAGTHGIAQARCRVVPIVREVPEGRGEARKQQPEHQRERHRLTQHASRIAQAAAPIGHGQSGGQPQQGRGRHPADADEVGEQPKGIALEQRRQAHEINDQRNDIDVALRVRLEQFQARHQDQQRGARGQAVEGVQLQEQEQDRECRNTQAHAARRGRAPAPREQQPNAARHGDRREHPHRERLEVRDQGEREAGKDSQELWVRDGGHRGSANPYSASARKQAKRWAAPRPGGISLPGIRRP